MSSRARARKDPGPEAVTGRAPVRALAVVLLIAVYLLALASLHPLDVAGGTVIALAVALGLRGFLFPGNGARPPRLLRRIARFPIFAVAVAWEITAGTWQVAMITLGLRSLVKPGIVAIPIGERSPTGIAATTLAITLSPGEVFVDLDRSRGELYVHVLDARDPEAIRERYERFYDRYQRGVFP